MQLRLAEFAAILLLAGGPPAAAQAPARPVAVVELLGLRRASARPHRLSCSP